MSGDLNKIISVSARPRQVIFDLDRTLVMSTQLRPSWLEACSEAGIDPIRAGETIDSNHGMSLWGLLELLGIDDADTDPIIQRFWKLVEEEDHAVTPTPGALDTVRRLGGAGIDLYLMTGSRPETAMNALESLELLEYFVLVLGSRKECQKGPDHYRMVIEASGLAPEQFAQTTATIGDGAADMRFGKDHDLRWRIGYNPAEDPEYSQLLREAGATSVISHLNQILVWT